MIGASTASAPRRSGIPAALLLLGAGAVVSGCQSIAGPSETWRRTVPAWSPYVVVSPSADALSGHAQAFAALAAHGAAHGVRISLDAAGRAEPAVRLAASYGLDVLGIVDDADLFSADVEGMFDRYAAAYPEVRTFQIGNEITTLPEGARMSIERYLDVLERIYAHVQERYAGVTLVSQATFGAGTIGADDLAAMAPRLEAMSPRRVVVGINVYTEKAVRAYTDVLARTLAGYRIWVTETGIADPEQELSYVAHTYPRLREALRADRIYWYALWAGDVGGDSGYSLITNATRPPIVPRPLFQRLTE